MYVKMTQIGCDVDEVQLRTLHLLSCVVREHECHTVSKHCEHKIEMGDCYFGPLPVSFVSLLTLSCISQTYVFKTKLLRTMG